MVYSAIKHAVVGFSKALALRLAPEGICVNTVCNGPVDTPMFVQFGSRPDQPQRSRDEVEAGTRTIVPLGRLGQPEEVATAACFQTAPAPFARCFDNIIAAKVVHFDDPLSAFAKLLRPKPTF
ncbi:MAG: SDR family NAD(P)-dependent oxidoreductase [Paracoccaceae bacterium]